VKGRIFLWSVTSALAGLLFGFDTVVISGAEQTIQSLWHLTAAVHGLAMGSALYGTVLGSLIGSVPTDRFGRKKTLTAIGALYVVSAIGCAFSWDVTSFIVSRFIGGLGIGVSTVAAPLYISEISPAAYRGRLAGMFQFNIVFGIIVAFFSNYLLKDIGPNAWRWMLGVAAVPSVVYTAVCFLLPESPRWLLGARGDRTEGVRVLGLIMEGEPQARIEAAADEIIALSRARTETAPFWTAEHLRPILLAFLIACFNQLSGINAVLYFAPRIFELAGLKESAAMLQSVGIGVTNLVFTFVGLWLIDRLGRRTLMYIGSFGYIVSLGLTAWAFFSGHTGIVPACIFAFIASHAVGQGSVIWVFISEIFPNRHRARGQALGSFTHWIFAAALTSIMPVFVSHYSPGYIFVFFCAMMVLQLVWVALMMPETKGISLEDMERRMAH
jgi:MFS transporter, SP family, arabinose:H+ symporter